MHTDTRKQPVARPSRSISSGQPLETRAQRLLRQTLETGVRNLRTHIPHQDRPRPK